MSSLKDREETFERKYVHDEEMKFRAVSRRNKLLGFWAAEKLGKSGKAAEDYALAVIRTEIEETGEEHVLQKIRRDFDAAGVRQSDHQIRRTMSELLATAIDQIKRE